MNRSLPRDTTNIEALIEQLKDQDTIVSQEAEERLIELNDPASIPVLTKVLKGDYACNWQAAGILLEIRGAEAVPDVLEALANPPWWDDHDGMTAVVGDYFTSADKTALAALVSALNDPDPKIRRGAAWGLDCAHDVDTIPALIAVLNRDPDAQIQKDIAITLASFRDMPDFPGKVMEGLSLEGQSLVSDMIAHADQQERWRDERQRHHRRESIMLAVFAVLAIAGIFALVITGKVR